MKFGILFDMDGTIWDSTLEIAQAWNSVTEPRLGITLTQEDMYRNMGISMDKFVEILFPGYSPDQVKPIMEECEKAGNEHLIKHGAKLYPKLVETLQVLAKKYHLYIVSNCNAGYIEAFLEHYQLEEYFCDHICFGDNGLQKGDNIALAIERNQLDRAVYVGDIQGDYEAALAGGAEFIHAAYGFGTVNADVPAIHEFSELPQAVANLLQKQ